MPARILAFRHTPTAPEARHEETYGRGAVGAVLMAIWFGVAVIYWARIVWVWLWR